MNRSADSLLPFNYVNVCFHSAVYISHMIHSSPLWSKPQGFIAVINIGLSGSLNKHRPKLEWFCHVSVPLLHLIMPVGAQTQKWARNEHGGCASEERTMKSLYVNTRAGDTTWATKAGRGGPRRKHFFPRSICQSASGPTAPVVALASPLCLLAC